METRKKSKDLEKLKIVPIQEEEDEGKVKRPIHPNLPNIYKGQLICIVAPIRSGKSVTWNNLLLNDSFYNDLFPNDAVHIVSNTISSDSTSRFAYQKFKNNCHEIYSDKIIRDLIKRQKAKIENKEDDTSFALILDDLLGQFPKNGRKGMEAINFATRFRHYVKKPDPCLVLYSTQRYFDLNPVVRNNCTSMLISGNIKSQKELEQISHDFADTFGGIDKFNEMLSEVRKEPFNWLYLRLDKNPPQAFKNFQQQLF
jgi:hypothetical protein